VFESVADGEPAAGRLSCWWPPAHRGGVRPPAGECIAPSIGCGKGWARRSGPCWRVAPAATRRERGMHLAGVRS